MPTPRKTAHAQRLTTATTNDLKDLMPHFKVRSIPAVVERLVLDYEVPNVLPTQLPRSAREPYTKTNLYDADVEYLKRLRSRFDFDTIQDVVAHLVDCHLHPDAREAEPANDGERTFQAILDFLKRKDQAKRAERKAQREATPTD